MKRTLNRLPEYDRPTSRSELVVFLTLGAVAVGLIGFTLRDAAAFAGARDSIVSAWDSKSSRPVVFVGPPTTNQTFTNLTLSPVLRNDRNG